MWMSKIKKSSNKHKHIVSLRNCTNLNMTLHQTHYCIEYQKKPFPERVYHNEVYMEVMMYIQKMVR